MKLHGKHLIGADRTRAENVSFRGRDPRTGEELEPGFADATPVEIDAACEAARSAFREYASVTPERRAAFLRDVASRIEGLGDALLERTEAETGLPQPRLTGERGRTVAQLRMFADLVEEGSWVDARIDRGQPDRKPLPRPDVRRMLVPLGPVAVFGASNFPLAFSVAGGDTASALAAGCPVVVKAHPAHPGASEIVAEAIAAAVAGAELPAGTFSMVHGTAQRVGADLTRHAAIRAVAFTGSLAGGRALFDLAGSRPQPIPLFAEMGSANPVFVLPGALAPGGAAIAEKLAGSVVLGSGQFCTNPGMTVMLDGGPATGFREELASRLSACGTGTMVHPGIAQAYEAALAEVTAIPGVQVLARGQEGPGASPARPALLGVDGATCARNRRLREEIYGPVTVAVTCGDRAELLQVAESLDGHLTATVLGSEADLADFADLLAILGEKVGRLVCNGVPTGVEVCPAMHHGGPYPATTDARSTSVGTAAILRFARPLCLQDFPQQALPPELRDDNPRGIWRTVEGQLGKD